MHLPHSKINNLTEVNVTEMPTSDMVFQDFNAHAHTVDTRRSFFPSPFSAPGNKARVSYVIWNWFALMQPRTQAVWEEEDGWQYPYV